MSEKIQSKVNLSDLLRAVGPTPRALADVCQRLGTTPGQVRRAVRSAQRLGYAVDVVGDAVAIRPSSPSRETKDVPLPAADRHTFAVASDLHFGSKYHLRPKLVDFIATAYDRGARVILLGGDLLDGCYRHGRWELTHHGFQDQCADFVAGMPAHPGLRYVGITGNHDETFEKDTGLVVHTAINQAFRDAGREDMLLLGARGAYVRLRAKGERRGLIVQLWHPLKGPAYALSYHLQRHVQDYEVGCKPDAVFAGHWHQSCHIVTRGVHAFSAGTFQGGGSAFGKAIGGNPTVGGWIVSYGLTSEGSVRSVQTEWVGYQAVETVREVGMH